MDTAERLSFVTLQQPVIEPDEFLLDHLPGSKVSLFVKWVIDLLESRLKHY